MAAVRLTDADAALVDDLRAGDEAAFAALVERYHGRLVRLARVYVRDTAVAEEVAQESWLALLRGIEGFEGRSSLRTWLFQILVNRARTAGVRERRSVPFSAVAPAEPDEPSVDPERFLPPDHPRWPGHWGQAPAAFHDLPEERLLARETRAAVDAAIERLPAAQREVITLRDVEGLDGDEVCAVLGLTPGNQRVLLHRARSRVRAALERHLGGAP